MVLTQRGFNAKPIKAQKCGIEHVDRMAINKSYLNCIVKLL